MDFSAQLESLKRTADAAAVASSSVDNNPDSYDPNKKPRRGLHHRGTSGRYFHDSREAKLRKSIADLPPYNVNRSPGKGRNRVPHLCLLFITIDDLAYEHIWREWCSPENQEKANLNVSLVCHAKHPKNVQSSWLKQRLLVEPPILGRGNEYQDPKYHSRRPEWGSIEITRAMIDLLQEGLDIGYSREKDERFSNRRFSVSPKENVTPVNKFVYVSETCLPVASLEEVRKALFGEDEAITAATNADTGATAVVAPNASPSAVTTNLPVPHMWDVSWVNGRSTPNNGYSRQLQFDKIHSAIPENFRWKADQWMALSRQHAAAIMDIDLHLPRDMPLWRTFIRTNASDELYFPTGLAMLHLFKEEETAIPPTTTELPHNGEIVKKKQVVRRRVTYADWSVSARNPASFTKGVEDFKKVAAIARSEGCLFARKFSPFETGPSEADRGERAATGTISAEEWKSVVGSLVTNSVEEETAKAES